jgi:hypothetical protein
MSSKVYAIKVNLGDDDWIYVTRDNGQCDWDLEPITWSNREVAEEFAKSWRLPGREQNVQVVEYTQN